MMLPGSYQTGFAPRDGYPAYPELWRGCVGAWTPSLGPTGATLRDWSGRQNHGTLTNATLDTCWNRLQGRWSLNTDGVNDFVDYGTGIRLSGLSVFSCSFWVYKTAATEIYPLIRYNTNTGIGAERRADYFGVEPTTGTLYPVCYFSVAGTPSSFQSYTTTSLSIPLNTWTYVGFTVNFNTSSGLIAVNNRVVAATRSTGGTPPTSLAAQGTVTWKSQTYTGSAGTVFYFAGDFDSLQAYERPLSASEHITASQRRGIAFEMQRQGYYTLQTSSLRRKILTGQV